MRLVYLRLTGVFCHDGKQDDSEDTETDGDEEDGSQSSTNLQAASRFHRYGRAFVRWVCLHPDLRLHLGRCGTFLKRLFRLRSVRSAASLNARDRASST